MLALRGPTGSSRMQSEWRFSAFLRVVVTAPRARSYSGVSRRGGAINAHRSSRTRLQRRMTTATTERLPPLLAHAVTAENDNSNNRTLATAPRARGYSGEWQQQQPNACHCSSRTRLQRYPAPCTWRAAPPLLAHAVTAHLPPGSSPQNDDPDRST